MEKGAITMNDKLLIWALADREFAQVLLFVKVCLCGYIQNLFALGQYDVKSYLCEKCFCPIGCTSQHCKHITESQSQSLEMQSDFILSPFHLI